MISRLNEDGTVDSGFGTDGLARTDFAEAGDNSYAVSVLPDGRILAAGTAMRDGAGDFALVRHLSEQQVSATPPPPAAELSLDAPAPNPARSRATLRFRLPAAGPARLSVYDVLGRRQAVLADGWFPAGPHELEVEADRLPAGVYLVELRTGSGTRSQRLTVVR